MKEMNNNPLASYIEAQMSGTAGIVQAALHGVQRVQEIMLRAMRDNAGEQMTLANSMSGARDVADLSRVGGAHVGPAAEQFVRYQQELIGAVTEMNNEMVQASYSLMERVGQALAASSSTMGLPSSGQAGGPMAAYEAGMRQWQGAMEQLTQRVRAQTSFAGADEGDEQEEEVPEPRERPARKAAAKRTGRR